MYVRPIGFAALVTFLVLLDPQSLLEPSLTLNRSALAQTPADKTEADQLLDLCKEQWQTSQFKTAIESCQQVLEIYRELGDRQDMANSLNNLGVAYESLGKYQQAIDYYEQSLARIDYGN